MTISSSLNASVTGLSANATRLATISDNIANAGTYGYKRAETDFSTMVVSSTSGGYSAGGVLASTSRTISAQGPLISSGRALDVAVVGGGMLPVATIASLKGATVPEMLLKPTGSFSADESGLVRTGDGHALMGWPVGIDGVTEKRPRDSAAGLEAVNVSPIQFAASPTTRIELGVNLPSTATHFQGTGEPFSIPVEYFDNLGASQTLMATFTPTIPAAGSSNAWTLDFNDAATDPAANPVASFALTFSGATGSGGSLLTATAIAGGTYDSGTGAATITTSRGDIEVVVGPTDGQSAVSQLAAEFAPTRISKNGSAAGILTGLEFGDGGYLLAVYDTGFRRPAFQIPIAAVANPNGMQVQSGQTFSVTPQSGPFYLWDSGTGPAGTLTGYALEESTTDIAGELTSLIRTQRAYSSNAKVIQTVDEMLQETANIKR